MATGEAVHGAQRLVAAAGVRRGALDLLLAVLQALCGGIEEPPEAVQFAGAGHARARAHLPGAQPARGRDMVHRPQDEVARAEPRGQQGDEQGEGQQQQGAPHVPVGLGEGQSSVHAEDAVGGRPPGPRMGRKLHSRSTPSSPTATKAPRPGVDGPQDGDSGKVRPTQRAASGCRARNVPLWSTTEKTAPGGSGSPAGTALSQPRPMAA